MDFNSGSSRFLQLQLEECNIQELLKADVEFEEEPGVVVK